MQGKKNFYFSVGIQLVLIAAVAVAAIFHVYGAEEGAGGFILWNRSEAYLFVTLDRRGNRASCLELPWILFKELASVPIAPDDIRRVLMVTRVTSSSVERHTVELADIIHDSPGADPYGFTPLQDRIYAHCPKLGGVCRWADDHFERATEQERNSFPPQFFEPSSRYDTDDFDNRADGWSRRVFVAGSPDRKFLVDVGDQFRLSMTNVATGGKNGSASIGIQRPGQADQRIATYDAYNGRLSGAAYRQAFDNPK